MHYKHEISYLKNSQFSPNCRNHPIVMSSNLRDVIKFGHAEFYFSGISADTR